MLRKSVQCYAQNDFYDYLLTVQKNLVMSMKKLFAFVAAVSVASAMSAQVNLWDDTKPAELLTYGVRAGFNVADGAGGGVDVKSKLGFFGGLAVDVNVVNSLSINSGLFFTQKGCKGKTDFWDDYRGDSRVTMNYLEVPVYVSYRLQLSPNEKLQAFFGPYVDYGIYGKATVDVGDRDLSIDLYDNDSDVNRLQFGLGLGAAYSWSNVSIGLSYQWGLTEIEKRSDVCWNNFNISFGYNF